MAEKDSRQVGCPDQDAILAFRRGELSGEEREAVALHLLFCNGCAESLNSLPWEEEEQGQDATTDEDESETEARLTPSLSRAIRLFRERHRREVGGPRAMPEGIEEGGLRVGQIWRTKSEGIVVPTLGRPEYSSVVELSSRPHLVLVTSTKIDVPEGSDDYHPILVAPIDAEVQYKGEGDLLVEEDDSPLGYSFIIQFWNGQMMLRENLEVCLGEIEPEKYGEAAPSLDLDGGAEPLGGKYSLEAVVLKGLHGDHVMRYRAKEYEETSYLRAPAQAFLETVSQKASALPWRLTENVATQRLDEDLTRSAPSLPPWLHLPQAPASSSIYLAAQQESDSGWPVELSADVEGAASTVRLKFNRHLSFVVAEFLGPSVEPARLLLSLAAHGREVHLHAGGKAILGALEDFKLSEVSSREEIVAALLTAGLAIPRVEKPS